MFPLKVNRSPIRCPQFTVLMIVSYASGIVAASAAYAKLPEKLPESRRENDLHIGAPFVQMRRKNSAQKWNLVPT